MATNFPTSLDALTNPTSSDSLSSPSHSAQHANANDAIEALQAKVGADSSAVASSLDYKVAQLEGRDTAGLVHISRTTIGAAVSSVTVSNAFSADYDNYKIIVSGGSCSLDTTLYFRLSPTSTTGYYYSMIYSGYTGATPTASAGSNTDRIFYVGGGTSMTANFELLNPYNASRTKELIARIRYGNVYGTLVGHMPILTSFSSFIVGPHSGTLTDGYIDVYGYAKA